jgi:hypothetical protein
MRNGLWTKGFGIGIIILFLGASVLPGINATVVNVKTADDNINNPTMANKETYIFIGLIKDVVKINDNGYQFRCILVFWWAFSSGAPQGHGVLKNDYDLYNLYFDSKVGFIGKHIIFGTFTIDY